MANNAISSQKKPVSKKQGVTFVTINENHLGQRIDNFLLSTLKTLPRSYVYKILRKGEVRINKKRAKPTQKLKINDVVRIPPIFLSSGNELPNISKKLLNQIKESILFEDEHLVFINKPSGLAVHGGSGIKFGLIEAFRQLRPDSSFIELVHRLDKDTSGIVMLAKSRPVLIELHDMLKSNQMSKIYQTLVIGHWKEGELKVTNRLKKEKGKKQKIKVVTDKETGKLSESIFYPVEIYKQFSLLNVKILTGRMHQIRTQLSDMGYPILGDDKYGDFEINRNIKKSHGFKRLFLHASYLNFKLKSNNIDYDIVCPLPYELEDVIQQLKANLKS